MQAGQLPAGIEGKLIGVLQNCRQRKDLSRAKRVQGYLREQGLDSQPLIANYLIPVLVECGGLPDAHQVFDLLPPPHRNVYSWTSLISGHIRSGNPQHALRLYSQMQEHPHPVRPNGYTYLALLTACASLQDAERGRALHSEIIQWGLERATIMGDAALGNTLVDMYGKCNSLSEARCVFETLPVRDAVSWNALIAGYVEHGNGEEPLQCLNEMTLKGICPDSVTFLYSLRACTTTGSLDEGHKIHAEITKRGLERRLYIGSTLVDLYTKCGLPSEARRIFSMLPLRDTILWNVLIAGYAECGLDEEARKCFQEMQVEGTPPDSITFLCTMKACGTIGACKTGQQIHAELTKRGSERELHVGNTMIDMYNKCRSVAEARKVFEKLPFRDEVSWNAMITGYSENGLDEEVLSCFSQMQLEHVSADAVTLLICLKACGVIGALEIGREIHTEVRYSGLERDVFLGSMLIDMYGKCGSVVEGREVFDKLPARDLIVWNSMIKLYGENHEGCMALACFEDMEEQGVKPDSMTFTCLLAACSHSSLVLEGQNYFQLMRGKHGIKPKSEHYACIVDLLARSGHVYEAEKFMASMQCPPCSLMLKDLLSACRIFGKVDLGEKCFQQLVQVNEEVSAACLLMADIYASAGRWRDANKIEQMRNQTNAKKKAGSAITEANKMLHEFLVGIEQTGDLSKVIDLLALRMRAKGFVPNTDLVFSRMFEEEK